MLVPVIRQLVDVQKAQIELQSGIELARISAEIKLATAVVTLKKFDCNIIRDNNGSIKSFTVTEVR